MELDLFHRVVNGCVKFALNAERFGNMCRLHDRGDTAAP
jgi:hypothetical protein